MIRWAFLFIFCLSLLLFILYADDTVSAQEPSQSYILADVGYEAYPTFSRVIIASNKKIEFVSYELQDPYRIVIDLIGVVFCELEEHAEYREGLVKSIDVIRAPLTQQARSLDEFFYAVDYVIITPASKLPYTVSSTEGGRVVTVDIGKEIPHGVSVSESITDVEVAASPEAQMEEGAAEGEIPEEEIAAEKAKTEPARPERPVGQADEYIVENIYYEVLDDASLVVISANREIKFDISKRYFPRFGILLKPQETSFTDLQASIKLDEGSVRSISIIKETAAQRPAGLDAYFYPIKYIVVEPIKELPFDTYLDEETAISIIEVANAAPQEIVERPSIKPTLRLEKPPAVEEIAPEPEEGFVTRREIIRELKEEIKKESVLKEKEISQIKKEEEEKRKLEAKAISERFGREILEDIIVKGKGILRLAQAQDTSIQNSPVAKTAKEEIALANLKKKEALRALFPQVRIKGSHTTGDVLGADFIEEVYGVQGEQAVYQGGRLWNTYQQSKVNAQIAGARYNKIENDLNYKVAEAYYNTVTSVMNVKTQQDLLKEAEGILKIAQGRRRAGLSTELEILNVKSQYNQIQFQVASAERDLALARYKLQQAMNLDVVGEDIDVGEVDTELQFKIQDVDLYKCLEMASENQPDILVNKFLVESNEYSEKIAKGKDNFKIDVAGFYGKADSYYDTEKKNLQRDWNIGVRVSKPFWGNTASYAFSKERTSRKVGQTDRTGSKTHAGEFSILDKEAIAAAAEIEEAKVNREKAENDLIEARRQIALEVKEAYYSYQEAIIQVKNSLEKVKFQEEAVKVAKAQAELNEALQSQLLEAMIKLSDERSLYVKALSDYNLALSKLNKALGIKDHFITE